MKTFWQKFSFVFLCIASGVMASASFIGIESLGSDNFTGNAADMGRGNSGHSRTQEGISLQNPARLAFDRKTSFMVSLDYQGFYQSSANMGRDGTKLSSFALGFPLGAFGAIGLGMWEVYSNDFYAQSIQDADTFSVDYFGSLTELSPSYALRLPGFMQPLALGIAWRVPTGHLHRNIKRYPEKIDSEQEYWQKDLLLEDISHATWGKSGSSPGYLAFSAQFYQRNWSMYCGFAQGHTLNKKVYLRQAVGIIDTTAQSTNIQEFKIPRQISVGFNYSLSSWLSLSADVQSMAWDNEKLPTLSGLGLKEYDLSADRQMIYALGLQKEGSSKFYESFIARSSFRLGGWYKDWYLDEVHEWAGTVGMGMPLGKRGAKLDVAIAAGHRQATSFDNEWFWTLGMSFTGVAEWGQSSRRIR
ncbi:MAG: hypothetical protein GX801_03250 [Fibrobacter sp.]|nr:hypothetical protein [Fibrobacter sp.]